MPYSSNSELPSNVKEPLPEAAQTTYREAFNSAYEGTCKDREDRDACASKIAWSAVKKNFKKGEGGKWTPKALTELSMYINKASYDKKTNRMNWSAVASDTEEDSYNDNMTLELFSDFIRRIESGEEVPEPYQEKSWTGGMPYMSMSHYRFYDENSVPGEIESVYIDGNRLKSKGYFYDTPMGRACFRAVCDDLYSEIPPEERDPPENRTRISIGFLDYGHVHKSSGYVFERETIEDICPECIKEAFTGESQGLSYTKGHLVHEALTRVPVNERTSLEVDKAMAEKMTRKDDAASIVGEELADELDEKSKMVGKSAALVTKSDEETDVQEETAAEKEAESVELETAENEVAEVVEQKSDTLTREDALEIGRLIGQDIARSISGYIPDAEEITPAQPQETHPLDEAFIHFRSAFDEIAAADVSESEKLNALQKPFNEFANVIRSSVKSPEPQLEGNMADVLAKAITKSFSDEIAPLMQKLDLLIAQNKQPSNTAVPVRRSIDPALARKTAVERSQTNLEQKARKGFSVDEVVRRNYEQATGKAIG